MKKIYIIVFVTIITLIIGVIAFFKIYEEFSFDGEEKVFTLKSNYTYNVSDDNSLEVLVYSNNPRSVIKAYKDVECQIKDDESSILGVVEEVERISNYKYKDETYYSYKLLIKPAQVGITFKMSNCIIETYDLKLEIGTLTLVDFKQHSTSPLDFTKIYAVGNDYTGFTTVTGFVISIKNKSEFPTVINDFYIGEYNSVSLSKAVELEKDISTSSHMNDYIKTYDIYDYSNNIGTIVIPANTTVKLLIPVYYKTESLLSNTLIYINKQLYIDNFNYIKNYDDLDNYEGILNESVTNFA
ncbi:MAG: hypothetical protein R3Y05_01965 [bacterium]